MKRSTPLRRKTPMPKNKKPLKRGVPMKQVSEKQKAANVKYAAALKTWRAQHDGRCEMISLGVVGKPPFSVMPRQDFRNGFRCPRLADSAPHHLRGRRGALLYDVRYFVGLCRECHDWIHANARHARALGWLEF